MTSRTINNNIVMYSSRITIIIIRLLPVLIVICLKKKTKGKKRTALILFMQALLLFGALTNAGRGDNPAEKSGVSPNGNKRISGTRLSGRRGVRAGNR